MTAVYTPTARLAASWQRQAPTRPKGIAIAKFAVVSTLLQAKNTPTLVSM